MPTLYEPGNPPANHLIKARHVSLRWVKKIQKGIKKKQWHEGLTRKEVKEVLRLYKTGFYEVRYWKEAKSYVIYHYYAPTNYYCVSVNYFDNLLYAS